MLKTVQIADDSATMRLSMRMLLQARHTQIKIREAIDGVDAIEKAKTFHPDLIVLDLAMPKLNGAEAATVLKNTLPETPVILFTMYPEMVSSTFCAAIGIDCFSKIDGFSKLLERVDALLPPTATAASGAP